SLSAGVLTCVEWTIRRSNVFCGVRLSHHVNLNSTMGIALKGKCARLLYASLCPNWAAAPTVARCSLHVARRRPRGFRHFRESWGTGSSTHRRTDISRQCPGGASRIPARELGYSLVAIGGGNVLSILS